METHLRDQRHDQRDARLQLSFLEEEALGLRRSMRIRLVVIPILAVWVAVENPYPRLIFFEGCLLLFALASCAPFLLHRARRYRWWHRYLFPAVDVMLLAAITFVPNPFVEHQFAPQVLLRFGNEIYVFLIIAAAAFSYRPRVVLWTGLFASAVWALATAYSFFLPDTAGWLSSDAASRMTTGEIERALLDTRRVDVGMAVRQALVFTLTSFAVAAFVRRSRELVRRHSNAERERTNLSRYFSANMVDELAQSDQAMDASRQQNVAVVFIDIVGFTAMSESLSADHLIDFLREFHGRMQKTVFDNSGTLDKYLGDGLMATFGTPRPGPRDATRALRCCLDAIGAIEQWNQIRGSRGDAPVTVAVGAHYGRVVVGDIGGEQRLEFAVLGDTVNVANRIEELTRSLGVTCLVSQDLLEAARAEAAPATLLEHFRFCHTTDLRGRATATRLWTPGRGRERQ